MTGDLALRPQNRYSPVMRYSTVFSKTQKEAPHDTDSVNAKLLVRGGFVRQEMAGVYSWLPLGLRVLRKVEAIIREEMNALGAQEILMPALQSKEAWLATGRWDSVDVLFKLKGQTGKELALGPTHEEVVTPLVQSSVSSYKDLPLAVYQIQTKYRDELRAKSGVLRGREFGMKDMYSFHVSEEDLERFYERVKQAYLNVYKRCDLEARVVAASGGMFSKFSHEFQVLTEAGEDAIFVCTHCDFAQNKEITEGKSGKCPSCGHELVLRKGVEVGNIFKLGTRFSDAFGMNFADEDGRPQTVIMGTYGLGTTRLVGAIVEALHDERGIRWPTSVAPYHIQLVSLRSKDDKTNARIEEASQNLYDELWRKNIETLWDDRASASPGEKFADADLIGLPVRLVISEKTLKEHSAEWKGRDEEKGRLVQLEDVADEVTAG